MTYDPAFMNTASCRSAITFIDGDKGILRYRGYPIEQLAERASVPRGRVAAAATASCRPAAEYDQWVHDITYHTYVHENIKTFLEGFRYDAHPMSMLCSTSPRCRRSTRRRRTSRTRAARHLDHPPAREGPDARGVLLPPREGAAVHLPRQRPGLRRELPLDGRADERAEVRGEPGLREGARGAVHPPRRPRAELLDERGARRRLLAGRSVLGGRGRHRRALRPAARRRQRAGAAHDRGDRPREERPGVHRGGEEREGAAASWASATASTRATIRARRS